MEVNRLLGDEIIYESLVTNIIIKRAVAENRELLRRALRNEGETDFRITLVAREHLDIRELIICDSKLADLHDDIRNFHLQNRENEYRRIFLRLCHINRRLRRLPSGTDGEVQVSTQIPSIHQATCPPEVNAEAARITTAISPVSLTAVC